MDLSPITPGSQNVKQNPKLLSLANKLEAQFLAEMLKISGIGKAPEGFGGGAGEDQFSSFLTQEYANSTVSAGGIGLSKAIYDALVEKENGQ